jgi:hypothetical protein
MCCAAGNGRTDAVGVITAPPKLRTVYLNLELIFIS